MNSSAASDQVERDVAALARRFDHRASNSESERAAAEVIKDRLLEYTPHVSVEPFVSMDSFGLLFASYYGEFAVVALLAAWRPYVAFAYGVCVFIAYLAEFTGYGVFSRLLPQFESQNVVAFVPGRSPKATVVITAHYDTGRAGVLFRRAVLPRLHRLHTLVVIAMLLVVASCFTQGAGLFSDQPIPWDLTARWVALAILVGAGAAVLYSEASGEPVCGAVGNASGVAALMALAERAGQGRFADADVYLVATGSKESWLQGMRHLLKQNAFDRDHTYFLNIVHVGAGALRYITGEGMLHVFPASPHMLAAARETAVTHSGAPARLRCMPTDAQTALTRGYHAMTLAGLDEQGVPAYWRSPEDTFIRVDAKKILQAAEFAEQIVGKLTG